MNTYTVAWGWNDDDPSGQNTIRIGATEELDAALDHIAGLAASDGTPRLLDLYEGVWAEGEPRRPFGFQVIWGHPDRVSLTWLGDEPGVAVDPTLPEWPEPIAYDQDEVGPHYTRLTPKQAREAMREYVQTGQRPTAANWDQT